ncbi:MAG: PPOX class F420-dependent oxidoreductase [Rhodoglobus sp.]
MTSLLQLGDEEFVSLTTFRRSGVGVATTVWLVRDGDALYVTTPAGSGKVKRRRNNSHVELRPSTRSGKVVDDAPMAVGTAHIDESETTEEAMTAVFLAKYGMQYRIMMGIEKVAGAVPKKQKSGGRVILRITVPTD